MRMIPCMAGCAGPIPMCIFWEPPPVPPPSPSMNSRVVVPRAPSATALRLRPDQGLTSVDRIVLPQRMARELLVHEEAAQVGMAGEADPEHVPHLALEPVGDGPEGDGAGHDGVVLVHRHL